MPRVLVVCTANICRSPVAEVILRDRLQKRGANSWQVESAGSWAQVKRGASQNSVRLMAEQGLDLTNHQSRLIDETTLRQADLVLCMESGHVEALRAEFPACAAKIYRLSEMVDRHHDIDDPYGQALEAYRRMVEDIASIVDEGLERIVALARNDETAGNLRSITNRR